MRFQALKRDHKFIEVAAIYYAFPFFHFWNIKLIKNVTAISLFMRSNGLNKAKCRQIFYLTHKSDYMPISADNLHIHTYIQVLIVKQSANNNGPRSWALRRLSSSGQRTLYNISSDKELSARTLYSLTRLQSYTYVHIYTPV